MNNSYKPKHIVIIGNGFDLSLGFKTSYKDFLESIEFKELIALKNNIAIHLDKVHAIQNWVDVENELSSLSRSTGTTLANFKEKYVQLKVALINYLKNIDTEILDSKSPAADLVRRLAAQGDFHVFNFNYTNSFENLLKHFRSESQDVVTHVHGCLKDGEIIFGIQDNSEAHPAHVFLKKSSSRLYDSERNDLYEKLVDAQRITFYGHSLGKTDHHYFDDFFENAATRNPENINFLNKHFYFYFHNDAARDSLYIQLNTLTKNKVNVLKVNSTFNEFDV
jgi:Bacteriophage abortive infection AbiH